MTVSRRLSIAAAAALMAVPALSACGFNVQTDQVYNPAVGVNDRSGAVDVLGAMIVADTKGSGSLVAGFSNNNQDRPDTLTQVAGAGNDAAITVDMGGLQPTVPPGGFTQLADLRSAIAVSGTQVQPGRFVNITFTFKNAQAVTLDVPVVARSSEYSNVPEPSTAAAATASPSPTASPTKAPRTKKAGTSPTGSPTASPTAQQ